jgi:phospho-N-acetylmuramoyl-pentapeptide-transferase
MIYKLLYSFHVWSGAFNVFRYITFRAVLGMLTALLLALFLGPWLIAALQRLRVGQSIRDDGPQSHLAKAGTPTMGGLLILFSLGAAVVAWGDPATPAVWIVLGVTLGFGAVGFVDDYRKISRHNSKGLSARTKCLALVAIALAGCGALWALPGFDTRLAVPFFKDLRPDLGPLYIPFAVFVVVGAGNAVNLTDGLDGLAIGPVITASLTYLIFAYVSGHARIAGYLQIPSVAGAG